jgi:hypothetical protein
LWSLCFLVHRRRTGDSTSTRRHNTDCPGAPPHAACTTARQAMTPTDAQKIVLALANGIDPESGEMFDESSTLNNPHVIRALYLAARALESMPEPKIKRAPEPGFENAGVAWTKEEDERLARKFDEGAKVSSLASIHRRTSGAITSRLVKLGRMSLPNADAEDA